MSLANCQYGYDTATVAGFQAMVGFLKVYGYEDPKAKIGWNIETVPQQLISSFLQIGTIIGVLLTHFFARYYGRKPAIWAASLVSFVAAGLQVGTENLIGLYFGRLLIGASNGFFITFANIYTAEVSPSHLRGGIVSFFGIWVSIGIMMGAVANQFSKSYDSKLCYQIPLASLFAIPTALSILMFFIPESPRWLLVHGRSEEAHRALTILRGSSFRENPALLEEEFLEMKSGIERERELATASSFLDMFKGSDRRRTFLCWAVVLSHSSSGISLIVAYGTFFFQMAGVENPFVATILKSFMGLVGVAIGIYLSYKKLGRRSMMLIGHSTSAVFMAGMGIAQSVAPGTKAAGKAIVGCALCYHFFYNGFSGAQSYPVANEVVSSRLRVISVGTATAINMVFAWLTAFTMPYFINRTELNWGAKIGYVWAGSNAVTFIFLYFFLPEMRNRTLEEIDELFQERVPTRQFAKYQCVSTERAREQVIQNVKMQEEEAGVTGEEKTLEVEHRELKA
ncbi:uncharacterized protein A1O9_02456 [Exophiala aquamarina CBS 119918]|uniref:Major facilitator superfamily (MFS) profile domain-containing protein n=1 Tax=Exophiala aquamarina CBS 119918 TaxID=1182545 RepID=A0A072PMC3_9EURO|nr:uncharacterized protein A1O9_02456 [Exophiala aquamarina CBS 119918]KEF60892.1 hypothetical protein A1O9_02456 [Exophiala aquamarina CBS 119918]